MAFYLVRFEGKMYANNELFFTVIAGGERAFMKMLAEKKVIGKLVFDQVLYPLNDEQLKIVEPVDTAFQDFDKDFMYFNTLSKARVDHIQAKTDDVYPGASLITVRAALIAQVFHYRKVNFFRVRDYLEQKKYRMLPRMAVIRLCGRLYIAVHAVDARVEAPLIVTIAH